MFAHRITMGCHKLSWPNSNYNNYTNSTLTGCVQAVPGTPQAAYSYKEGRLPNTWEVYCQETSTHWLAVAGAMDSSGAV